MSVFTDLKKDLLDMMKQAGDNDTSAYDTQATVVRTEGDIIWVHIPGGVAETPVRKTINAKVGDEIQVRVSGGRAWAVGNATSPPTDDTTAIHATQKAETAQETADGAAEAAQTAWNWADDAHDAAETAWNHANDAANAASAAQTSAGQAQASATQANTSANNALTQLSTIEDVFDVLNWIADHGTYALTTDTSVVPGKYYFTRSGTSPNYSYTVVTNPTGNPKTKGYYELTGVDEAVTNYISSHLALTDQGLWVIKDNQGYKVLLANDGLKIYDNQGHLVSTFGESIVFDSSRPQTIGNNSTYIKWYDSNNDQVADKIEISGDVTLTNSVTIGGMPTKVSDLTNDSGFQTASDVSSAITNIRIGGANLITGTNSTTSLVSSANATWEKRGWRTAGSASGVTKTSINVTDCPNNSITYGWNFTANSITSNAYGSGGLIGQNTVPILPDTEYTLSCYAKGVGRLLMFYGVSSFGPSDGSGKIDVNTTTWTKYRVTFTTESNTTYVSASNTTNVFFGIGYGTNIDLSICGMKLEKGNMATDWSPSPEDVDADISDAAKTATNYLTTISGVNGITVHNASDTNNFAAFNSNGMQVYKGGNTDAYKVASFGDTVQIGKTSASHSIIDADGQRIYGRDGTTLLAHIGYGEGATESGTDLAPYFTFGTRTGTIGADSFAEGYSVTASGEGSHAEGNYAQAKGNFSHAEGVNSIADGNVSHAEGFYTNAVGLHSHAQNSGTYAAKQSQTAIGRYNVEDEDTSSDYGKYAFIIGNGVNDEHRSNAFTVDWDGNLEIGANSLADFIVSQGTSGIWTYRVWKSGVKECFGRYSASIAITTSSAQYGGYRSGQLNIPTFPITFTSVPVITATAGAASGYWVNNVTSSTTGGTFYLSMGASSSATTRYINFHVIGK